MQRKFFYTGTKKPPQCDIDLLWTPTIAIEYTSPTNRENLQKMMAQKCRYVFFSKHGVIGFSKYFSPNHKSSTIHAVGKSTSQLIQKTWGICSTLDPVEQNALGMIKLFESLQDKEVAPVIVVQGNKGRKEFSDWLRENEWPFITTCVYKTALHANALLKQQWQNNENDYVIFTSPSTVHGFLHTINAQDLQNVRSLLISIGPTTSCAIQECGGTVHHQSPTPNIDNLIVYCATS